MPATQKQKEFLEILLKKNNISIDLRYEDMEKEDINFIITQFNGKHRNKFVIRSAKHCFPDTEVYTKAIQAFLERFKR